MPLWVLFLFLLIFVAVSFSAILGLKFVDTQRKKQMAAVLETVSGTPAAQTKLLRDPVSANGSLWQRLLHYFKRIQLLEKRVQQAGLDWTLGRLGGLMVLAALAGGMCGWILPVSVPSTWRAAALAVVCGWLPYFYVQRKRSRRLAEFEEQFPEALDFLARSMRAGHAFSISLEMLSEEMPDPLGLEFRTLFNEHNLGAPLELALRNLVDRVPLLDLRFFASAVMLQRQTGGNLSEILTRLAYVIRERFRLKGQVQAASAHGRMTASILALLPVVTMLGLLVVAPGYLQGMAADSDGKYLIAGSIVAQIFGNWVIRRIIHIKV